MQLFYTPHIEGDYAYFPEEEARHCIQVLRKKVGAELQFVDGRGGWYRGEIVEAGKKTCVLSIKSKDLTYDPNSARLSLAVAPTKNIARFEWLLEKATEIGVYEIIPLLCQRSERKRIRKDRLEKILIAAMKQSLQSQLPLLRALTPFPALLQQLATYSGQRLIAHGGENHPIPLWEKYRSGGDVMVLIGPEGDFSPQELEAAFQNQMQAVSLGPNRLRTETAGMVACHTINLQNQLKQ
ncbi:MAG: 16S rRNA (uracil(1498)-N(3))-methyltransferase [Bacteroidota bacterium]